MAYYTDDLHGRLKIIIKKSGGYNKKYYIDKLVKDYNLNKESVEYVFNSNLDNKSKDKYIEMLKNNCKMKDIINLIKKEKRMQDYKLTAILGTLSPLSGYKYFK